MSARTTLHFIRHADALPQAADVLPDGVGYDELPLSEKGREQAAALAARMRRVRALDAVYASPTLRARETADALAAAFGLAVREDARLREIHLGEERLDGVPPERRAALVRARLAEFAVIALRDGSWRAVRDAEDPDAIRERAGTAVAEILSAHPGGSVAVVSHAGTINAYLAGVVGTARDFFFPIGNASLSSVVYDGERAMIVRLNDTAHLERDAGAAAKP